MQDGDKCNGNSKTGKWLRPDSGAQYLKEQLGAASIRKHLSRD